LEKSEGAFQKYTPRAAKDASTLEIIEGALEIIGGAFKNIEEGALEMFEEGAFKIFKEEASEIIEEGGYRDHQRSIGSEGRCVDIRDHRSLGKVNAVGVHHLKRSTKEIGRGSTVAIAKVEDFTVEVVSTLGTWTASATTGDAAAFVSVGRPHGERISGDIKIGR
jgi:hypothetical protein